MFLSVNALMCTSLKEPQQKDWAALTGPGSNKLILSYFGSRMASKCSSIVTRKAKILVNSEVLVLESKCGKKLFPKKHRFWTEFSGIFEFYYTKISKSLRNWSNSETAKKFEVLKSRFS